MSIDLRNFGMSNLQGSIYKGTFDDYDDLVANVPIASFGDSAKVENSQGTKWLPFTFGGTYYAEGTYYFDGTIWVSDVKLIAEEIDQINIVGNWEAHENVLSTTITNGAFVDAIVVGAATSLNYKFSVTDSGNVTTLTANNLTSWELIISSKTP